MALRHDEDEAVAAEGIGLEPPGIDRAGDDADIADAFGDEADDLVAQALLEVDADLRMAGEERAQRLGQEFGQRIGVGEDPDLAGKAARDRSRGPRAGARPGRGCARACWRSVRPAGVGDDPLPAAHEEGRPERLLHVADAGARGGKRQICAFGAVGDAAGIDHMAEQAEVDQIELHRLILRRCAKADESNYELCRSASQEPIAGFAADEVCRGMRRRRGTRIAVRAELPIRTAPMALTSAPTQERPPWPRRKPQPRGRSRRISRSIAGPGPWRCRFHRVTGIALYVGIAPLRDLARGAGLRTAGLSTRCRGSSARPSGSSILFGYTWVADAPHARRHAPSRLGFRPRHGAGDAHRHGPLHPRRLGRADRADLGRRLPRCAEGDADGRQQADTRARCARRSPASRASAPPARGRALVAAPHDGGVEHPPRHRLRHHRGDARRARPTRRLSRSSRIRSSRSSSSSPSSR